MPSPTPFTIRVEDKFLEWTETKVNSARFPDELEDAFWQD